MVALLEALLDEMGICHWTMTNARGIASLVIKCPSSNGSNYKPILRVGPTTVQLIWPGSTQINFSHSDPDLFTELTKRFEPLRDHPNYGNYF